MATDQVAACFIVSGKVQGVFFRASAAREAVRLGISGHAINLADGRVEVLACGAAAAVEEFFRWLQLGPPAARVEAVERQAAAPPAAGGFRTG